MKIPSFANLPGLPRRDTVPGLATPRKDPVWLRWLPWIAGIAFFGVAFPYVALKAMDKPAPVIQQTGSVSTDVPGGFAASCVAMAISAGSGPQGDSTATDNFVNACQPGIDPGDLDLQTENAVQAVNPVAYGPPLSGMDRTQPNTWSVLVGVDLREAHGGWRDRGEAFYRATVYVQPNGMMALRGLPYRVVPPVANAAPDLEGDLSGADLNDPRTATINGYLHAYYLDPTDKNPEYGTVGDYFAPSATPLAALHDPTIKSVDVLQTAYTPRDGNEALIDADAEVAVTHIGGSETVEEWPFVLRKNGADQWQIVSIPSNTVLQAP